MDTVWWLLEESTPYGVLFFNNVIFSLLRNIELFVVKERFVRTRVMLQEFTATLELCADVAELGIVYERHGMIAYTIFLLLWCLWWGKHFGDAEACPNGPVEDLLFGYGAGDYKPRILGQILGAVAAGTYIQQIWGLHLIEQHKIMTTEECQSSLMTTIGWGFLMEASLSCVSRFFVLRSLYWTEKTSLWINSVVTVILCLVGLNSTGGYFNGILASALMFGCGPHGYFEHFVVYWLGNLLGGFFARYLNYKLDCFIDRICTPETILNSDEKPKQK
ncbi:aquaporin-11-like isoform X2 [Varroa jacobsoni]|uniref:Aquaporin n=1 Tax=Varroa destructor TaxID=109461 RepID=A0A7M7KKD6_VARDE|nr:aquaporin-11-like isoform X1 [Varroa destructor]XP_022667117.1 aquaporin-11-like isoform X1 [Varroa destructor]XP_022667194.1 aquaporin-11-like isoform X1 [Varroa destructor]XP_022667285.1 aquaporin-11-like isoform X1 [Varroa destructor]XP_022688412.1 aquaporin-11-like isoform X2 [Varroa jacobsoni]